MKAIVYSFDAYIAVVIALIGIGLLITYSTIESNYIDYYQVKMLSLDGLRILIETDSLNNPSSSLLYLSQAIPDQYSFRLLDSSGIISERGNVDEFKKIKVSTSIVVPIVSTPSPDSNPYSYKTCSGGTYACGISPERNLIYDSVAFDEYVLVVAI